jgi:Zn-dependent protease
VLHLGSIRGTTIDVDFSFFILVGLFVVLNYNPQQGIHYALLWIPIAFLSVLVHELAHAAAIGIFGYGSSNIILGGMGGVTINARRAKSWQDMIISLAGPASSFVLWGISRWLYFNVAFAHTDPMMKEFLPRFWWANFAWGIFNLIPVPPLDGGHATRSFFSIFLQDRTAFMVSTWIALIIGGAVAIWAFTGGQFFIAFYIAWFVFMAWQRWRDFQKYGTPQD